MMKITAFTQTKLMKASIGKHLTEIITIFKHFTHTDQQNYKENEGRNKNNTQTIYYQIKLFKKNKFNEKLFLLLILLCCLI